MSIKNNNIRYIKEKLLDIALYVYNCEHKKQEIINTTYDLVNYLTSSYSPLYNGFEYRDYIHNYKDNVYIKTENT